MKWSKRRHSGRPGQARRKPGAGLEALEGRQLLTGGLYNPYLPTTGPGFGGSVNTSTASISVTHPIGNSTVAQQNSTNEAQKVVTGKDRAGNEYSITVKGPGSVIVTDITPNDGVLDDNIDTIQLLNTTSKTVVIGQTVGSARVQTNGVVEFNHLIDANPVGTVSLNGFTLTRTALPITATGVEATANAQEPEIYLPGGINYLSFHNIDATYDASAQLTPYQIIIGDPNTPLKVQPTIHLDSIFNTVTNSSLSELTQGVPQTVPTVNIVVNGQLRDISFVSSGAAAHTNGSQAITAGTVSSTGRTAIQAKGVGHLKVVGSATNTTVSRTPQPFQHGFSGVDHIGTAEFGGTTDAVGLDVNGTIGHLRYLRGSGNPTGASTAATSYGITTGNDGYSAFGLEGGRVVAKKIGRLTVGAAALDRTTPQDPDLIKSVTGQTNYVTRPGNALTNTAIVTSGSIGRTVIIGNAQNSEVKAGASYSSYIAGLEATRAASRIGKLRMRGELNASDVSSSYSAGPDGVYGTADDVVGPGSITGNITGSTNTNNSSATTTLGNTGSGFFARRKNGKLPLPAVPRRNANGVLKF